MSTEIYSNSKECVRAVVVPNPVHTGGGDPRMIQIHDPAGRFAQIYPPVLQAILDAWRVYSDPDAQREGQKHGIELILDRVEALRVRIDSTAEDEEIQFNKAHWLALCGEALVEIVGLRKAWDGITAVLALPYDSKPFTVEEAVRICVRMYSEAERKLAELAPPLLPAMAPAPEVTSDDPEIALLQHLIPRYKKLDQNAQRRILDYVQALGGSGVVR